MELNRLSGFRQSALFAVLVAAQLMTGISVMLLAYNGRFVRLLYLSLLAFSVGVVIVLPQTWLFCGFPQGLFLLAYAAGRESSQG